MARLAKFTRRSMKKIIPKKNNIYFGLCIITFILLCFLIFTFFTNTSKVVNTPIYKSSSKPSNQEKIDEYLQKINFDKKTTVQQSLQHITNPDTTVKIESSY